MLQNKSGARSMNWLRAASTYCVLAVLLSTTPQSRAFADDAAKFDWEIWSKIAVQDGGRMKPFDTLARESIIQLTESSKPTPGNPWTITVGDIKDWSAFLITSLEDSNSEQHALLPLLSSGTVTALRNAAETKMNVDPLRREALDLRRKLKKFETLYSNENLAQPTSEQLREFVQSQAFRSQNGDEGLQLLDRLKAVEQGIDRFDTAAAAVIRDLNDAIVGSDLAQQWDKTATSDQPAGDKLKLAAANREALSAKFPNLFKPLALASNKSQLIELRKYPPVEIYVRLLMGWQGWDTVKTVEQLQSAGPNADDAYWGFHKPDAWDSSPLVNARYEQMGPKLKPETRTAVSIRAIAGNTAFKDWARELIAKSNAKDEMAPVEEKALAVIRDYQLFMNVRIGINFICGPNQSEKSQDWAPLFAMMTIEPGQITSNGYLTTDVEQMKSGFMAARQGLLANNASAFNAGSEKFAEALERMGKSSHLYPTRAEIGRELHYNKFQPFLWTTMLATAATVLILIGLGSSSWSIHWVGFATLLGALGMTVYGNYLRIMIAGRPPVTNMYETIIWSSFVGSTFAVILSAVYRKQRVIPLTASAVLMLATLLAHMMPVEMGESISPLQPVLRSNYWLIVHVMTIVGSYGAFLLAWGLGNVGLGCYLFGKDRPETIKPIANFCVGAMCIGWLMLTAGTILGGWWAAESWGRFWGWDPKETWAFIGIIGYIFLFHCRLVGWVKNFGMLAGAVLAFNLIVMAWYGVNFVLGAGLHAYAFGTGGLHYVVGGVIANLIYVAACAFARSSRKKTAKDTFAINENADAESNEPHIVLANR